MESIGDLCMKNLINQFKAFWAEEDGLSAVEYVIAGALIAAGVVAAFGTLGNQFSTSIANLVGNM